MNSQEFYNWCRLEYLAKRALEFLRNLFRTEWITKHNQPWKDQLAGQQLSTQIDANPKKNTYGKKQKSLLKRGDIKNWDITLLKNVILDSDFCIDDVKKNSIQKNAQELASKRNELAHNASKKVSDAEFETLWNAISGILVDLGDSQTEIDELKSSIQLQNKFIEWNENIQKANDLKAVGNNYFKEKKFSEAITSYTDAIVLPDIPDHDLAIIYANRSACYLEECSNKKDEYEKFRLIGDALKDAKKSKELNPEWYKGHFRLGKAYLELKKLDKALKAFERALDLYPKDEDLKTLLDVTRKTLAEQKRYEDFDFEEQKGPEMNPEEFERIRKAAEKHNPVLKDVHEGHDYRDKHDFEKASQSYGKAVNKGNAEAMYNLAILHQKGLKVKKDSNLALSLLMKAAGQPAFDLKLKTPNVGVAESEHSIGVHHSKNGDIEKAIPWFERAAAHGSGRAAYFLGKLYLQGEGVKQDTEKSEQYFLIAASRNDLNAADRLVEIYNTQKIPEKALKWNKIAKEKGSKLADERQKELEEMMADCQKSMEKLKIVEWEEENNLSPDDLTLRERIQRKLAFSKNPKISGLKSEEAKTDEDDKEEDSCKYDIDELKKYSDKSETAQRMYRAMTHFKSALELLEKVDESVGAMNEEHRKFITNFASCYKIERNIASLPKNLTSKAKKIASFVVDQVKKKKKLSKDMVDLDQDAIICFAVLNADSPKVVIDFLSDSIQKYPQNKEFLLLRGNAYKGEEKYEHALRDFNKLLEREPENYEALYSKAVCLRNLGHLNAVKAFEDYLAKAPIDDIRRPEAYYEMGVYNSLSIKRGHQNKEHMESISKTMKEYYERGLEMEKKQLPFLLPYKSSNKHTLEFSINPEELNEKKESVSSSPGKPKLQDVLRTQLILDHRNSIKEWREDKRTNFDLDFKPASSEKKRLTLINLKPIFLDGIDFRKENGLNGCVLEVTVIDVPLRVGKWTVLIVKDSKGSVQNVALWNFGENIKGMQDLGVGSKLSIINPSVKIMLDQRYFIRVDEPSFVFFGDKVNNMCACCGDVMKRSLKCEVCKNTLYCSEECRVKDREEFHHQLVCVKK